MLRSSYRGTMVSPFLLESSEDGSFERYHHLGSQRQGEREHTSRLLLLVTQHVSLLYERCNPQFKYETSLNPRRVLTKPSLGVMNRSYDNQHSDLILYVNDILGLFHQGYIVLDLLGSGTFGQVVRCKRLNDQRMVAVKVIKSKVAYLKQGRVEVSMLLLLRKYFPNPKHHIVQLVDHFMDRGHYCIVFDCFSINLFELLKQNMYRGLSINLVRSLLGQIMESLAAIQQLNIVHCDLKPENIMLKSVSSVDIVTIDFGSACLEGQTMFSYIQSRFYRSPEVLLGLPYSSKIDMWSLGCIAIELYLGLPIFPGNCEYDQIRRILATFKSFPQYMLRAGKNVSKYFDRKQDGSYAFKSRRRFEVEQGTVLTDPRAYFNFTKLEDLVRKYPLKKGLTSEAAIEEMSQRSAFLDLLKGLLDVDPYTRWNAVQCLGHPFLQGKGLEGPYQPPPPDFREVDASYLPDVEVEGSIEAEMRQFMRDASHPVKTRKKRPRRHSEIPKQPQK